MNVYEVDRVYNRRLFKTDCCIKEIYVYTHEQAEEWFSIICDARYSIAVIKGRTIMFHSKDDYNDVFILYSKPTLDMDMVKHWFKYSPLITSVIYEREFLDLEYKGI